MLYNTRMKKNLILGTAWGYNLPKIASFVKSWKKYCADAHLILVVEPSTPRSKYDWLVEQGVDVRFFTAGQHLTTPIHNTRFYKYLDILLEEINVYDRVFLTDVRDVVFQGDIFSEVTEPGLHCFLEDGRTTCTEGFNRGIITHNFGEKVWEEFKDLPIICSGTTLGSIANVVQYISAMIDNRDPEKLTNTPDDQAVHIYILHKNLLPNTKHENCDGVATMALVPMPEILTLPDGRISVCGKTPAVLHQYDRFGFLVDHFKQLYLRGVY